MKRELAVLAYIDAVELQGEITDAMMRGWKQTTHDVYERVTRRRFLYLNKRVDELERLIKGEGGNTCNA